MQVIRGIHNIKPSHFGCVATIGNFDGVHLGHRAIIRQLASEAKTHNLPTLVILFEPQPREFFAREERVPRLSRLREKLMILQELGVDKVLCVKFDAGFAEMSAEDFIADLLVTRLGVRSVIVGNDFRFGKGRRGDLAMLQSFASEHDYHVLEADEVCVDDERVSSTRIRKLLVAGHLQEAKHLLGRDFGMCGRVAHGDKRGRIIGFPTANIYLHRPVSPVLGVYAVTVDGLGDTPINGVANVGNRPTVDGTRTLLEVHLFDFDSEIYGRYVRVNFSYKLRDEKRYDSFDLLKQQIFRDAQAARDFFEKVKA